MSDQHSVPRRRRRFAPLLIVAGVASAIVLSLSMTNTLSAFTAAINNSNNTVTTGSVLLQETQGGTTCLSTDLGPTGSGISTNSSTCATINKYGGSLTLVPGGAASTATVVFKNIGTAPAASFQLTPAACVQTNATPGPNGNAPASTLCGKLNVVVTSGGTTVYTGTAAGFTAAVPLTGAILTSVNSAAGATFVFSVSLDTSAGNTFQGLVASQQLAWTIST